MGILGSWILGRDGAGWAVRSAASALATVVFAFACGGTAQTSEQAGGGAGGSAAGQAGAGAAGAGAAGQAGAGAAGAGAAGKAGGSGTAGQGGAGDASAGSAGSHDSGPDVVSDPVVVEDSAGETEAGQPCGDPVLLAKLDACRAAKDQGSCQAAGGTWTTIGLSPVPECQCQTGQGSCPCDGAGQCKSACVAKPSSGPMGCAGVTSGHCSPVSITVGCWCFFNGAPGVPMGICVD